MIESLVFKNLTTLQQVTVAKEVSDFVLDEADLGTVAGTHHSYKFLNQVGVYIDSTTLEQREVSISGWVIGENYAAMLTNRALLNSIVNPLHYIECYVFNTYKLVFKPDYSIRYSVAYEENNEVLCKFLIQGTCADPMFSTIKDNSALIAAIIPKFKFPLVIPKDEGIIMGLREPSLLANIMNEGDIETGMLIEFSAITTVENPSLFNVDTREMLKIDTTIAPGDKIIVSTESGKKYVKGIVSGEEQNYFKYWNFDSVWLQLHKGNNIIRYNADSNPDGLQVLITFQPKFLEVQ